MGKWNEDKILNELKEVTDQLGKFPTHQNLCELGRGDLRNAIIGSGKKISEYASALGQKTKQRNRDFWNKITIKEELKKVCNNLGYFPTRKELIDLGYGSLQMAMWQDGESIQYWQKLLGYEPKRNENGYWENEDTIVKELMGFSETYEFLPTQQALRDNGRYDLARAIDRSGKGLAYFQKLAGWAPPFYESIDGHFLDSSYELMLDEWLYNHGIKHDVHGYINRNYGKYRYDFKIKETYIEIWGYSPNNKTDIAIDYNENRSVKEKIYKELNLDLINIESSLFTGNSFDEINENFTSILSKFI